MFKESVICIIIVISIFVGNNITQGYTKECVEEMDNNLNELRNEILNEDKNQNEISEKIDKVIEDWRDCFEKLAYFIEHNELEKVETSLVSLKSFIETKEYNEGISELDKSIFLLNHIEDKNSFNLMNIF